MVVALLGVWCLASAVPSETLPTAHVIILTGANDAAAGKARQDAAVARMVTWKDVLTVGKSAPLLKASAEIPGLKPGFHVVLLGVCGAPDLSAGLALAKAMDPGAYSRELAQPVPTDVAALSCPTAAPDVVLGEVLTTRDKTRTLRLARFDDAKDPTSPSRRWRAVVTLLAGDGTVLEETLQTRDAVTGPFGYDCAVAFEGGKKGITVTLTDCVRPRGCPAPASMDGRVVFGLGENKITVQNKVTRDHAPPCSGE